MQQNLSRMRKAPLGRVCYETAGLKVRKAMFGKSGHRFLVFEGLPGYSSIRLQGQGSAELHCADEVQHALQVVNHGRQTDLHLRALQPAEQEAWIPEDAVL